MSVEVTCIEWFSRWQVDLEAVCINGAWSANELTLAKCINSIQLTLVYTNLACSVHIYAYVCRFQDHYGSHHSKSACSFVLKHVKAHKVLRLDYPSKETHHRSVPPVLRFRIKVRFSPNIRSSRSR